MTASTDTRAATPTYTGVMPMIMVEDSGACSEFYQRAFGAVETSRVTSDGANACVAPDEAAPAAASAEGPAKIMHLSMLINGGMFAFNDSFPEHGHPFEGFKGFTLHLQVNKGEGDAWWNRAVEAGCHVVMPFQLQFWGDRYGLLRDPFGVSWSIGETQADA